MPEFRKGKFYEIDLKRNESAFDVFELILEDIGLPDPSSIKFKEIFKRRLDRL